MKNRNNLYIKTKRCIQNTNGKLSHKRSRKNNIFFYRTFKHIFIYSLVALQQYVCVILYDIFEIADTQKKHTFYLFTFLIKTPYCQIENKRF